MDKKTMLLELKHGVEAGLRKLEEEIILSKPTDDDENYRFLIKKAINFRETLKKIDHQLNER